MPKGKALLIIIGQLGMNYLSPTVSWDFLQWLSQIDYVSKKHVVPPNKGEKLALRGPF